MGATLGCKALSLPKIVITAAIFETLGAVLLGNFVGNTISNGLVNLEELLPKETSSILNSISSQHILSLHSKIWSNDFLQNIFSSNTAESFAELYMLSMGCVLFGSAIFLAIATYLSLPVSTTHAVVGSILGNGVVIALFVDPSKVWTAVNWSNLWQIVASWVMSPFVGCIASFISWFIIKLLLFDHRRAKDFILGGSPILFGVTGGILSLFILQKGLLPTLEHVEVYIPWYAALAGSILLGAVIGLTVLVAFVPIVNRKILKEVSMETFPVMEANDAPNSPNNKHYASVPDLSDIEYKDVMDTDNQISQGVDSYNDESQDIYNVNEKDRLTKLKEIAEGRVFKALVIVTSCCIATAHGAGDISNASGPLAAIVYMFKERRIVDKDFYTTWWCTLVTALGLVFGLATLGYRVMRTLGEKIAKLTPARAYIAQFCTAFITLTFSVLGLPISTTHVVVGAIYGITFVDILTVKGVTCRSLNLMLVVKIISSWVLTLPLAALFSGLLLVLFKLILGY